MVTIFALLLRLCNAGDLKTSSDNNGRCAAGRKLPRGVSLQEAVTKLRADQVSLPMQNLIAVLLSIDPNERPSAQVPFLARATSDTTNITDFLVYSRCTP
jgi:hypothetical protein